MKKLTKRQVLANFRIMVLPEVRHRYEQDGRVDVPARREAWNNWVDMLAKNGEITWKQAESWGNPF